MSLVLYEILGSGGLGTGGFNFDTKLRRQSMARDDLFHGKTLIHSDSTEYSRPILERSGLVKVSTTTPYLASLTRLRTASWALASEGLPRGGQAGRRTVGPWSRSTA